MTAVPALHPLSLCEEKKLVKNFYTKKEKLKQVFYYIVEFF